MYIAVSHYLGTPGCARPQFANYWGEGATNVIKPEVFPAFLPLPRFVKVLGSKQRRTTITYFQTRPEGRYELAFPSE